MLDIKFNIKWMIAICVISFGVLLLPLEQDISEESKQHTAAVAKVNTPTTAEQVGDLVSNSEQREAVPTAKHSVTRENNITLTSVESGFKPTERREAKQTISTSQRSEERKRRLDRIQELREVASQKDWDKFLEIANDVLSMPDYLRDSALIAAIRDKAPKSVFESLLARGAQFQSHHLMRVVMMDDLPLLNMLISLGLDIHMTDYDGENAVNVLVSSLTSRKIFDFLLVNNVAIKTGSDGIPLLTKALDEAVTRKEAVYYAYKLIQYGAEITAVDRELVEKIRNENQAAFNLIQRNIPELITD